MNRTLKLALGVVLGLGMVTPSFAQNFPDIPDNHWAYEALANLKGKILYGYPDGLFRPARPMSRAEFAVAINQLYQMMMAKSASTDAAMAALEKKMASMGGGGANQADMDAMKKDIADMKAKMGSAPNYGSDMAAMKKLMGEFEKELAEQGVNMDSMKKDMADMAKRLSAVEGMKGSAVSISGDGNWVMIAGFSDSDGPGYSPGQRVGGVGDFFEGNDGDLVGMNRDFNVFHEFNVNLAGDGGEGVTWKTGMSYNNMFGWSDSSSDNSTQNFGNMSEHNFGHPFDSDMSALVINEMTATFDTSIGGQGFTAEVGRFRHSGGAFFLQREDTTEFYHGGAWDDGKFAMDGGKFDFGFGGADLTVFIASLTGNRPIMGTDTEDDTDVRDNWMNPMYHDSWRADAMMGAELSFKLGAKGNLKAVHYWMDSSVEEDLGGGTFNRMNTSGLEANFNMGPIELWGAFAQTDFMLNNDTVTDSDNTATAIWAGMNKAKWGIGGYWTVVDGNFGAFGDWGRLGTEWRPANIDGYGVNFWIKPSERMKLSFNGEWFDGAEDVSGFFGLPLTTEDSVTSYTVKMDYNVNEAWDLMVSWESVDWDFPGVGGTPLPLSDPEQTWFTIGLSRNLSDRTSFSLKYMASDVDFKSSIGDGNPLNDAGGWEIYKGGFLSSQLTFKF